MCARARFVDSSDVDSRVGTALGRGLAWLGGGWGSETPADHGLGGVLVVCGGALAWLVTVVALAGSVGRPLWVVIILGAVVGLVVPAAMRATISGIRAGFGRRLLVRIPVVAVIGLLVGECASVCVFIGPVNRTLDARAARRAATSLTLVAAERTVDELQTERARLDWSVNQARGYVDDTLVVARCEANPNAACPADKITGVPGDGPELHTANARLATAQQALDAAVATHDRLAPELDSAIVAASVARMNAEAVVSREADRSPGARWIAMNRYTLGHPGAMLTRILVAALFVVLVALPLMLRRRGDEMALALYPSPWLVPVSKPLSGRVFADVVASPPRESGGVVVESTPPRLITGSVVGGPDVGFPCMSSPVVDEPSATTQASDAGATVEQVTEAADAEPVEPSSSAESHAHPGFGIWPLDLVNEVVPVPDIVVDFAEAAAKIMDPLLPPVISRVLGIHQAAEEHEHRAE